MCVISLFIAFYWLWDSRKENEDYLSCTGELCHRTQWIDTRRERQRGTVRSGNKSPGERGKHKHVGLWAFPSLEGQNPAHGADQLSHVPPVNQHSCGILRCSRSPSQSVLPNCVQRGAADRRQTPILYLLGVPQETGGLGNRPDSKSADAEPVRMSRTQRRGSRDIWSTQAFVVGGGVCRVLFSSWTIHKEPRVWRAGVSRFPGHSTARTVGRRCRRELKFFSNCGKMRITYNMASGPFLRVQFT